MKNYYEILEVDRNASIEIIKGVYKLHIKENHPDLFQGEEKLKAEERMKMLNEAYEVLSDEIKREKYDYELQMNYEREINLLKEENERLKRALMHEKEQFLTAFDDNNDIESPIFKTYHQEYVPDENVTYENNKRYIQQLSRKEMLLKIIMTVCIVIAVSIGLYRATGFNLFEIIWKFFSIFFASST